jgi:hypothetical protein
MSTRLRLLGLAAVVGLWFAPDTFACGDKFLVGTRGTRYQRPKNARAASVLIYANPSSGMPAALGGLAVEAVLKHEGHRYTTVETLEQLSAILSGGRFDVVLTTSQVVGSIEQRLGSAADAPVVVALCVGTGGAERTAAGSTARCNLKAPPKERSLLEAIDKAVARHDQNVRRSGQARG